MGQEQRLVNHDQELEQLTHYLRSHGRALKLGLPLKPPSLPRSKRMRQALEEEAANDHRVRVALDAGLAAEKKTRPSQDRSNIYIH